MWEPIPDHSIAYPPERLIGRKSQQEAIRQAIREGARIVFIEGGAGIGKTRLLEEVENIVSDLPGPLNVLGIVDFYDTAMHGSLALEEVLAREIQKQEGEKPVGKFFEALEKYRIEEASVEEVHRAFKEVWKAWVGNRWVILRFDTAEFLEYGQEAQEVLEACEIYGEEVPAAQWLRQHLPDLEQVTALIAARPTRLLRQSLEKAIPPHLWCFVPLDTLDLDETRAYFQASRFGQAIDEEMVERVWLLTGGRPILISLAIDWLIRGVRVDEIYEADIPSLKRWKEEGGEEWQNLQRRFEQALVEKVRMLSSPMDGAVYYAARARKGFTASMLRRMLAELSPRRFDLSEEDSHKLLEELSRLSFVKRPYGARKGWHFLHDEMYDLLDRFVWQPDYPGYTHQAEVARFLADEIYGEEAGNGLVAESVKRAQEARTHREFLEAQREVQVLRTERLFYQLEANPVDGYREYIRLSAQAISQWQHEWDDMLRIEALRFMRTLPERARSGGLVRFDPEREEPIIADSVNRDCTAQWVQRYAARGDYQKADRIARKLLEAHPDWGELWKARVLFGQGIALTRRNAPEADRVLQEALKILEAPGMAGDPWLIGHETGMAYLFLGLYARAKFDWTRAAEMHERAWGIFEKNNEPVEMARALTNLAYVVTQRGEYIRGIQGAREAEQLRRKLGDEVGTAMALNTLAFAEDRAGTYTGARTHALEALSLLQRIQQTGRPGLQSQIAIVHLNLGTIYRHVVERSGILSNGRAEEIWWQAEVHLDEASKYEEALEPFYRYELYNQLGLLYNRWANWIAERTPEKRDQYYDFMQRANAFHQQADEFAGRHNLPVARADNLEDWAWVYHLRQAYKERMGDPEAPEVLEREVFWRLQQAEELIREAADSDREGLQEQYVAGSIHHQWGRYVHKFKGDVEEALRHYALSIVYYDRYSQEPVERRDRVLNHLIDTLGKLPPEQVQPVVDEMFRVIKERGLPTESLRHRLENLITGPLLLREEQREEQYG